jgi:hypothetical protein
MGEQCHAAVSSCVAYTISKQIDQTSFANAEDAQLERVIAAWDIPQNLQINFLYQLPFGTGRSLGAKSGNAATLCSERMGIFDAYQPAEGHAHELPVRSRSYGSQPALPNPFTQWFNTCAMLANGTTEDCLPNEPVAWTIRQPDTLQMWSSGLASERLPGIHNVDISVIKHSRIKERFDLLFRTDFINAFNSPQFFSDAITSVTSGNFGRISGAMDQSNLPRFVQFWMKLQF